MKNKKFLLIFVIFFAFIIRFPFVGAGLPYFQNEDEMHHFNRTITMIQEGSFNPNYFLKPSLHFYLRIPVTAIAFIWNVKKGNIQKLSDIKITNNYGLSNYSSTVSHKGIVKWNRMFSLILSILTLILIFLITKELTNSFYTSIIATSLFAIAPPQIELSTQINVDIPVMFFCTLSVFTSLKTYKNFSLSNLILLSFLCGLAISTKYNAFPIYILPITTLFFANKLDGKNIAIALLVPIIAFFMASPYALIHYNLFLNQLAYEVKHYGIDGHVGHIQNPGFSQLYFYTKWFSKYAIGFIPLIFCIYGIYVSIIKNITQEILRFSTNKYLLVLVFPLLFMILMIFQKANFTRNMLMALPFFCIFASIGISKLLWNISKNKNIKKSSIVYISSILILLFFLQPFIQTILLENKVLKLNDSRTKVSSWVRDNYSINKNILISGQLELEHDVFNLPNVIKIDQNLPFENFYNKSSNYLILPNHVKSNNDNLFTKYLKFKGQKKDPLNRLYVNPNVTIYKQIPITKLDKNVLRQAATLTPQHIKITQTKNYNVLTCSNQETTKDECWLTSKLNKISLNNIATSDKTLIISYTSPWKNQKVWALVQDDLIDITCNNLESWKVCKKEIKLPKDKIKSGYIYIAINKLISPKYANFSSDERFLGITIK